MAFTKWHLRRRIQRAVKKWRRVMALDHWDIDIFFSLDDPTAQAQCTAYPYNETAYIDFNLEKIMADLYDSVGGVEDLVVHELAHCVVGATGTKENERQVTHVARAIQRAYYREK